MKTPNDAQKEARAVAARLITLCALERTNPDATSEEIDEAAKLAVVEMASLSEKDKCHVMMELLDAIDRAIRVGINASMDMVGVPEENRAPKLVAQLHDLYIQQALQLWQGVRG